MLLHTRDPRRADQLAPVWAETAARRRRAGLLCTDLKDGPCFVQQVFRVLRVVHSDKIVDAPLNTPDQV